MEMALLASHYTCYTVRFGKGWLLCGAVAEICKRVQKFMGSDRTCGMRPQYATNEDKYSHFNEERALCNLQPARVRTHILNSNQPNYVYNHNCFAVSRQRGARKRK